MKTLGLKNLILITCLLIEGTAREKVLYYLFIITLSVQEKVTSQFDEI